MAARSAVTPRLLGARPLRRPRAARRLERRRGRKRADRGNKPVATRAAEVLSAAGGGVCGPALRASAVRPSCREGIVLEGVTTVLPGKQMFRRLTRFPLFVHVFAVPPVPDPFIGVVAVVARVARRDVALERVAEVVRGSNVVVRVWKQNTKMKQFVGVDLDPSPGSEAVREPVLVQDVPPSPWRTASNRGRRAARRAVVHDVPTIVRPVLGPNWVKLSSRS